MPLPAGPKESPWIQLFQWIGDPLGYLHKSVNNYGDLFTARFGARTFVMVSNPKDLETMLAAPEIGAPGEVNDIVRPLLGDNSVILLGGDRHKKRRKLLMPPFHGERMRNYGETIANIADKITYSWNQNTAFLARDLMQDITLDVILQVVFGVNYRY